MYNGFTFTSKYIKYYFTALKHATKSKGNIFVNSFTTNILQKRPPKEIVEKIENIRIELQQNIQQILIDDFGAGSVYSTQKKRSIKSIANSSLKPKKYAFILFNIISYYKHKNILELGTSLGITTSYLALANPNATITTFEGAKTIANEAKKTLLQAQATNVNVVVGNLDNTLLNTIDIFPDIDLAFIDGNHRYTPTINYFNSILKKVHANSVVVLDDIHWSKEMENAWECAKNTKEVTYSIDLFFIGILFFKKEINSKQHFVLWH